MKLGSACLLLASALGASPALAAFTLLGDTVGIATQNNFGGIVTSSAAIVSDPGVESFFDFGAAPTDMDIDFGATSITFRPTTSAGGPAGNFLHFTLSDLDPGSPIAGFSVSGSLRGDMATTVTLVNEHTLQVNFDGTGAGFGWVRGNAVTINLVAEVPEPGSALLAVGALAMLGVTKRCFVRPRLRKVALQP